MKKNSEVRIQESESRRDARILATAALSRTRSKRSHAEGFTLRYQSGIQTRDIFNLVGVLNPIIHPPVIQNSF